MARRNGRKPGLAHALRVKIRSGFGSIRSAPNQWPNRPNPSRPRFAAGSWPAPADGPGMAADGPGMVAGTA